VKLLLGNFAYGNTLTVDTYTQTDIGTLALFVGKDTGIFFADGLLVDDAELDGLLAIVTEFAVGDSPDVGTLFDVLLADTIAGEFADAILPVFDTKTFAILYDTDVVMLEVFGLLTGDANNDGVVNFADFIAVEQNFGKLGVNNGSLIGDANDDGRVDGSDWLAIEQNFGNEWEDPFLVPEPAVMTLMYLVLAGVMRRRR